MTSLSPEDRKFITLHKMTFPTSADFKQINNDAFTLAPCTILQLISQAFNIPTGNTVREYLVDQLRKADIHIDARLAMTLIPFDIRDYTLNRYMYSGVHPNLHGNPRYGTIHGYFYSHTYPCRTRGNVYVDDKTPYLRNKIRCNTIKDKSISKQFYIRPVDGDTVMFDVMSVYLFVDMEKEQRRLNSNLTGNPPRYEYSDILVFDIRGMRVYMYQLVLPYAGVVYTITSYSGYFSLMLPLLILYRHVQVKKPVSDSAYRRFVEHYLFDWNVFSIINGFLEPHEQGKELAAFLRMSKHDME
jgi:hypothetical protein